MTGDPGAEPGIRNGIEVFSEGFRIAVAFAPLFKAPLNDAVHRSRDAFGESGSGGILTDGELAGQELVENDAYRVEIGAFVNLKGVRPLFGGLIMGSTDGHPRERWIALVQQLGKSEVQHGHMALIIPHDVLRFQVTVNSRAVGIRQGVAELAGDGQNFVQRKSPSL